MIIKNNTSKKQQTIITYLITGLFFFLPFERIPTVDLGFYTVKISYVFGLLLLALTAPRIIRQIRFHQLSQSDKFLALFWLSGLASLIFSPDKKRSLMVIAMWSFMFLLYIVLGRLIDRRIIRRYIEPALFIAVIVVCLFGIYQFLGDMWGLPISATGLRPQYTKTVFGFTRIQSVGLEPLYFGNFLLVPLFLIIARYICQPKTMNRHWPVLVLIFINITLGIARGVYAALLVTLPILLIYLFIKGKSYESYRRQALGIILAGLVAAGMSFVMIRTGKNGDQAANNFVEHAAVVSDVKGGGESVSGRIANYKFALKLFKEKPLLGTGVGSYGVLSTTQTSREGGGGYGVVNNEYLEILTEMGIVGFILFVLFLGFGLTDSIKGFMRTREQEKVAVLALILGIAAIFIQYNFFSTLYIIHLWVYLALLRAHLHAIQITGENGEKA